MKNDLFEKAKQAVAVENGYSDWGQVLRICDYEDVYRMMEEVFKHGCNEAVKAAKTQIMAEGLYQLDAAGYYPATQFIEELPLPFPQQPDGL